MRKILMTLILLIGALCTYGQQGTPAMGGSVMYEERDSIVYQVQVMPDSINPSYYVLDTVGIQRYRFFQQYTIQTDGKRRNLPWQLLIPYPAPRPATQSQDGK